MGPSIAQHNQAYHSRTELKRSLAKPTPATLTVMKARVNLLTTSPFFGGLALRLKLVEDPSLKKPMSTDGVSLRFNPATVQDTKTYDFADLKALLALHTMRCLALHPYRRGNRDKALWDRAGEYAVSPMLLDAGFKLPAGTLFDPRFKDHTAEQIHAILQREEMPGNQSQPNDESGNEGGVSQIDDAPGDKSSDQQQGQGKPQNAPNSASGERSWQLAAIEAAMVAKKRGELPGAAARIVEDITHPPLDWRVLTRRFVTEAAKSDYRWTPPNRRYLSAGLCLPSLRSEEIGEMVVWIDCSGSTMHQLSIFGAELKGIWEDVRPRKMHLVWIDAAVHKVETIEPEDAFPDLVSPAAGGTDFRPGFTWVEDNDINPACGIYFTDMQGLYPDDEPAFPVLWAAAGRYLPEYEPPFGEVVTISEE